MFNNSNEGRSFSGEMKLLEKKGTVKFDVDLQAKMGPWVTGTKGYFFLDGKSQVSNLTVEYKANPKASSEKIKIEVSLIYYFSR